MAKILTEEDRKQLIQKAREMGIKGRVLTPEEHRELVKGKEIVFSENFIRKAKKLLKEQKV